ncbi:hypothetical protein KP509_02G071200 [Ceratopteris richardii]|uniref:Uncharacterized protein n=1 Tax=Ceratopteris richardii TaxID=49495 RepID=A0A8T2VAY4_CERRI|nr:hypothetical protein KP509_02G071200 [Ceratopteris richardii]
MYVRMCTNACHHTLTGYSTFTDMETDTLVQILQWAHTSNIQPRTHVYAHVYQCMPSHTYRLQYIDTHGDRYVGSELTWAHTQLCVPMLAPRPHHPSRCMLD